MPLFRQSTEHQFDWFAFYANMLHWTLNKTKEKKASEMCFTLCNQTKACEFFSVYPEQSLFSNDFGNKYWYDHEIPSIWSQHTPHIQFARKLKSANSKVNFCIFIIILYIDQSCLFWWAHFIESHVATMKIWWSFKCYHKQWIKRCCFLFQIND